MPEDLGDFIGIRITTVQVHWEKVKREGMICDVCKDLINEGYKPITQVGSVLELHMRTIREVVCDKCMVEIKRTL